MIERLLGKNIEKRLKDGKAIILCGPRQVGKSTLMELMKEQFEKPIVYWNGDQSDIRNILQNPTSDFLKTLIGTAKTLIIDEAQRIENIGIIIKLITDQIKNVKVIATGSSSFDLANKINEPLTGRKWEYQLFPLSFEEMTNQNGFLEERRLLEHRLVFGYYPEIVTNPGDEIERLKNLSESYLYKDVLQWENIQKPEKLEKLLTALALQMGNEVSYNELSQLIGIDNLTVEKYIKLLEQSFIIFRLDGFNRNLRNEIKKGKKIYFYDNGIRNAILNNFNPLNLRDDVGKLWENFLISERMKTNSYHLKNLKTYFWRTHAQQEIDYLEEAEGKFYAYEFKWNDRKKAKIPKNFSETYKPEIEKIITKENFHEFVINH
ncbi:ATP-binding protein [Epilithonimonas hominis]|uniref:ATP-binding protein n=1 Tax=Epilithonimonas hominis TaxID=420404 RepID=A0A3N0X5D0_9FLAO|nr:ATP-binding protein [Epilithonimonas hominis]ROI12562.1 ATP-binding protein [Epilithonimonas hominis]